MVPFFNSSVVDFSCRVWATQSQSDSGSCFTAHIKALEQPQWYSAALCSAAALPLGAKDGVYILQVRMLACITKI